MQMQQGKPALTRRQLGMSSLLLLLPAWVQARSSPSSPGADSTAVQRDSALLMGTRVDIIAVHADPAQRESALTAAWDEMLRLSEMMSRYRSASQISLLAQAAGAAALPVAPELMQMLQQAARLHRLSEGRFDISVGAYSDWHFEAGHRPSLPDAATLRRQRGLVDASQIELDAAHGTARLARAGMKLDLGGIAKLPILEAGLRQLQAHGIANALINGGGDVLCSGTLLGQPWRIGLRDPRAPQRLLGVLPLRGGVVAASGDYERGFDLRGRRYHHILDPRRGQPSQGLHGLALVADDVTAVNGWGAAMMVAGPQLARQWAAALPGVEAMLADKEQVWLSSGLRQRLGPNIIDP
ncbi:FAD:protein FMN transferase [Roseateles aquae]|nr:FAD:protein FMN transferase [Paucibacter sp. APW11]